MAEDGAKDEPAGPKPAGVGIPAEGFKPSAIVLQEMPSTLLSAGYHLRFLNAWRRHFKGQAELAVIPVVRWLCGRISSDDPHVAQAATDALQAIGLGQPATRGRHSLRDLESVTGIRRETLRRSELLLEAEGWVSRSASGVLTESARLSEWLQSPAKHEQMRDFRWTADRLRELLARPADDIGVPLALALGAMRACRTDELPAAFPRPVAEVPAHFVPAALVHLHGYNVRHLLQLAPFFSGDIVQAILLGEIGHRNVAAVIRNDEKSEDHPPMGLRVSLPDESVEANRRRASNAYSLALALDVPYETIRRKLTLLCRGGRLTRDGNGLYWVNPAVAEEFLEFNRVRRADMLATAGAIDALAGSGGQATRPSSQLA